MKILLLQIDGKLPNIALHKLAAWHKSQGDEVIWNMPLFLNQVDRVYLSTIFTKSWSKVRNLVGLRPDALVGGTGTWGFVDPPPMLEPEVEATKALINYGFTSRGCVRRCPFCLVPQVEGNIRTVGDIYDIWDGQSRDLTLFDNNILALPEHFEKICDQIAAEGLTVDFNQGLDIRLLTPRAVEVLKTIKLRELRFAFDDASLAGVVEEKVALVREAGLKKNPFFYVLVGFNTTFEEDLARLNILRKLDCRAYVMRYEDCSKLPKYIRLAEWVNQQWTFAKYNFEEFDYLRNNNMNNFNDIGYSGKHHFLEDE